MASVKTVQVIVVGNVSQAQRELRKLEETTAGFSSRLSSLGGTLVSAGRRMSELGSTLTRQVTAPIVAAGTAATKLALDYDTAFTRIAAISNASARSIAKWRRQVLELAGQTARSPRELADALFFLASAGLDASQVMPTLEASAKAAASGLGETSDVARLVANTLNAYAGSALKASQVTDVLVAAVREGSANTDEFAAAMGRILPIASKAGVEFNEIAASLAALSNIGLDVNEGVTAMRGLLQALEAPGTQAAETMRGVGISADRMRRVISEQGLLGALRLLEEATGGNIDTMRRIVPNIRALVGAFGLTSQEARKVDAIFRRVRDSAGSLEEAFRITARSAGFTLARALAQLQAAAIRFGDVIAPVVAKVAMGLGQLANALAALPPGTREMVVQIAAAAAAAGPALKVIGLLTMGVGRLVQALAFLAANPIVAVVAGLAILAAAFARTEQGQRLLHQFVMQSWPEIQRRISVIVHALVELFREFRQQVLASWRQFGAEITAVVRAALQVVVGVVQAGLQIVEGLINVFTAVFRGDWRALWAGLRVIAAGAWQAIQVVVSGGLRLVLAILQGAGSVLLAVGQQAFRELWTGVRDTWRLLIGWVRGLPGRIVAALSGLGVALFQLGLSAMRSLWDGLRSAAGGILAWVRNLASSIASKLNPANWFSTPEEHYRKLWGAAFRAIAEEARRAGPALSAVRDVIAGPARPATAVSPVGVGTVLPLGRGARDPLRLDVRLHLDRRRFTDAQDIEYIWRR